MIIHYSENNTQVVDGYKYNRQQIEQAVEEIIMHRLKLGLKVTRSRQSYIHEWITHNRLYKLGYQRSRTKDVDLEENIKPIYQSLYNLLGR